MIGRWSTRYAARRAWRQRGLLVAIGSVLLAATGLLGICTLLLTTTADQGFIDAVASADTDLVVTVPATDHPDERLASTHDSITTVFSPLPTQQTHWATSSAAYLPETDADEGPRVAYLGAYQSADEHTELESGRWGRAADGDVVEVTIPARAAAEFDLGLGETVPLSTASGTVTTTVTIVGIYQALEPGDAYWSHDPLGGRGYDSDAPLIGAAKPRNLPTAGAFLVSEDALKQQAIAFESIAIVATAHVDGATPAQVLTASTSVKDARATMRHEVDPDATAFSSFTKVVQDAQRHTAAARAIVVIALLMVAVITLTALVLAARLLGVRRVADRELLVSRGASTAQIAGTSVGEAVMLGGIGALVGPPLAWLGYAGLISVPLAADAGLSMPSGLSPALWATCAVVAAIFASLLIGLGARSPSSASRAPRRGALARSGLDVVLVLAASLGLVQLTAYGSPTGGGKLDVVLALTPVACIAAGAALSVRVVPLVSALASRRVPRMSRLVLPLALWNIARRPQRASGAVFLLTLAVAAATFAPGFISTWQLSQHDQADLIVGADVRVDDLDGAMAAQASAIGAAADAAPSPVARGRVPLGGAGSSVATQQSAEILGIDASKPELLRGRLELGSWRDVVAPLSVRSEPGPELPGKPESLSLTMAGQVGLAEEFAGTDTEIPTLVSTTTAMVRDARGATWPVPLPPVVLDGGEHRVAANLGGDGVDDTKELSYPITIEAIVTHLELMPGYTVTDALQGAVLTFSMASIEGVNPNGHRSSVTHPSQPWVATIPRQSESALTNVSITSQAAASITGNATLTGGDIGRGGANLVLTAYDVPDQVPVVISTALAGEIAAKRGTQFSISVPGGGAIDATVASIVDALPSLPTEPAIMIDLQTYSRASIADGAMTSPVTGWQLEVPVSAQHDVVSALSQDHLRTVSSRASTSAQLLDSPSRVGVQLAAVLVAIAAVALGIAGFALHLSATLDQRRLELARLYGMGVSRRTMRRAVSLEAAILAVLAALFGSAIGAFTNTFVSAKLAISAAGEAPVPVALTVWPWPTVGAVIAVFGILFASVVVTRSRRSTAQVRSDVLKLGDDT